MALINCPECGIPVSSLAGSCPKCAYPIAGGGSTQANAGKIQTVEQRSKRLKLEEVLSKWLCWGSGFVIFVAMGNDLFFVIPFAVFGLIAGFIWRGINEIEIWWHHK